MTDDTNREDPAVIIARIAAGGAVVLGLAIIAGGVVSAFNASAADVNAMAGGWTAMGAGFLLALIGAGVAFGVSMIMRRNNQHHEAVMIAIAELREAISPVDEVDLQRRHGG